MDVYAISLIWINGKPSGLCSAGGLCQVQKSGGQITIQEGDLQEEHCEPVVSDSGF